MENIVIWSVSAVVAIGFYAIYVSLIKKKNRLKESASGIDVQLQKRYDLIPNLLTLAAQYMAHEKSLMEEIAQIRTEAMNCKFSDNPAKKMDIEKLLDGKMREFKLSAENYPDLKSNQTMLNAMEAMHDVEEHIAAARRFYNSNVTELKNAVEIFPSSFVAMLIGIQDDMPFYEAENNAKESINAARFFK